MAGSYVSPGSINNPTPGQTAPATWGDAVNAALDYFDTLISDAARITFTPTIAQGASGNIAKTVNYSKYRKISKEIFWTARLTLTAAGTAGSAITVTLPVNCISATGHPMGYGVVTDASTTIRYSCLLGFSGAVGTLLFVWSEDQTGSNAVGVDPAVTLASGDVLDIFAIYEVA